jgi:hypothetical protein
MFQQSAPCRVVHHRRRGGNNAAWWLGGAMASGGALQAQIWALRPHLGLVGRLGPSVAALPLAVRGVARAGGGLDGDMLTVAR